MPFGSPGGDVQCQAMLQVFLNVVEFGMPLQRAIEMPRVWSMNFPNSFAPHDYVPGERLRLAAYRSIAAALDDAQLAAVRDELQDRYGPLPDEADRLLAVAAFRNGCRERGLTEVVLQGQQVRFAPMKLRESQVLRLKRLFPGAVHKQALDVVLVPHPKTAPFGGQPLRDAALLAWATDLLAAVLDG